jgi:DNA (cytosine-5)-methyltransferase 1
VNEAGKPKLVPVFVEWLMSLEEGFVTDPALGLTPAEQLHALGNGVVPLQAAAALTALISGISADACAGPSTRTARPNGDDA